MSLLTASGFMPRCGDCCATLEVEGMRSEELVPALDRFREDHRLCGYGVPFGPVQVPAPRRGR